MKIEHYNQEPPGFVIPIMLAVMNVTVLCLIGFVTGIVSVIAGLCFKIVERVTKNQDKNVFAQPTLQDRTNTR